MIGYYHRTCTVGECPVCGYVVGTAAYTTNTWPIYRECAYSTSTAFYDFVKELPSAIEAARLHWRQIRAMAKRQIWAAPRAVAALNIGMHLRRMRASAGLPRARTA